MAILDNSIGAFSFIALVGQRLPPKQTLVIDDRPGVTGTEFTRTARKGRPFSLVSQVDAEDYDGAWGLYHAYLEYIDYDPVELVQGGRSSIIDANYKVKVLDVVPLRILTIRGAVGNLISDSPNEGFAECRWDLVAVPLA